MNKIETVTLLKTDYDYIQSERRYLGAQNEILKKLLAEAVREIHDDILERYPPDILKYPDQKRRYEREMDLVNKINAALRKAEQK
jgi:hypothetical protein